MDSRSHWSKRKIYISKAQSKLKNLKQIKKFGTFLILEFITQIFCACKVLCKELIETPHFYMLEAPRPHKTHLGDKWREGQVKSRKA